MGVLLEMYDRILEISNVPLEKKVAQIERDGSGVDKDR